MFGRWFKKTEGQRTKVSGQAPGFGMPVKEPKRSAWRPGCVRPPAGADRDFVYSERGQG